MKFLFLALTNILIVLGVKWLLTPSGKSEGEARENIEKQKYRIWYPLKVRIVMSLAVLVIGGLFVLCLGNDLKWWTADSQLWCTVFSGFMFALCLYGSVGVFLFKVEVNGDNIEYRNSFGIKRRYAVSEIDRFDIKPTKIVFYGHGKKLFTIDRGVEHYEYLAITVSKYLDKKGESKEV